MSYTNRPLNLVYEPREGWAHFVLYVEPGDVGAGTALNAEVTIEPPVSRYAREWVARLERCAPNGLHCTLVTSAEIPSLFHPCVQDDPASPAGIAGDGCVCRRTLYDPATCLPVVAEHYRAVGGEADHWTYRTLAPLGLRADDRFDRLIIDRGSYFWIRTVSGTLMLLPERRGRGYGVGYGGGGPATLAAYVQQLIDSDGQATGVDFRYPGDVETPLDLWLSSGAANATHELTLADLKRLHHG